jgi:hypothetical protein
MLAWIFAIGLMIWLLYSRFRKNAFIFRLPLGMPEGTVRAYISIILVSFPFMFVWQGSDVPDIISNMLFLVTAFYFEKRSSKFTAKTIVKEFENPQQQKRSRLRFGLPMYWPKYSVRTLLIVLIVVLFFTSPPNIIPTITNHDTFANLLITMGSFILGLAGGRVGKSLLTRRLQRLAKKKGISLSEASEKIDPSMKRKALIFENILSIIVIMAVLSSLFLFTFNLSPGINLFGIVPISVRENLLQFISLYFGFRQ